MSGFAEACVIESSGDRQLAGILTLADAYRTRLESDGAVVASAMRTDWPVLNAETSVWQAMDYLRTFTGQAVPVVESTANSRLLGVVTEQALVTAYLEIMERVRREEHGSH